MLRDNLQPQVHPFDPWSGLYKGMKISKYPTRVDWFRSENFIHLSCSLTACDIQVAGVIAEITLRC